MSSIVIICFCSDSIVADGGVDTYENNNYDRRLRNNKNKQKSKNSRAAATIKRVWDVCPEGFPTLHAIIHERNPRLKENYERVMGNQIYKYNGGKYGINHDQIPIGTITEPGTKFALLRGEEQHNPWAGQASIWNERIDEVIQTGHGRTYGSGKARGTLVPPLLEEWKTSRKIVELEGDYFAYTGWQYGNYGHFIHDNLPNIAYLKSIVPENIKFLLGYHKLHERILRFIDEDFVEKRVKWVDVTGHDNIYQVTGSMSYTPWNSPMYMGCCSQFDPLRQWMETTHPSKLPEKKYVIFYTRSNKDTGGRNEDIKHGRVLDPVLEKKLLKILRAKMDEYGRKEEIVIFDGQDNGKTMSIERQFMYFRSASVIIGPHGSGLGGNYVWTYPNPKTCDDRVRILEFLPGEESAQVQALHVSYFMQYRKWPFEYHQIMYDKSSTHDVTQIDIGNYMDALDTILNEKNRTKTVDFVHGSAWEPEESTMETYLEQVEHAKKNNIDFRVTSSVK